MQGVIDKIQADYIMINGEMIFRGFDDNESRLKIIHHQKHAQMCESGVMYCALIK